MPRPLGLLDKLEATYLNPAFKKYKMLEAPDHHTLLILYVDKGEATKITATGDDHFLARV